MLCLNWERKDALSVYVSHYLVLFPPGLKNKYCKNKYCLRDSRYVGCTSQKLQNRIKQHFSKSNRFFSSFQKRIRSACQYKSSTQPNTQSFLVCDSAIGLYLLQNPVCAQYYDDSIFCILSQGRSSFHLSALEATFIKNFRSRPLPTEIIRIQLKDCELMTLSPWSFFS